MGAAVKPGAKRKPRGRPFTGRDDPRTNLKGRPKNEQSITVLLRQKIDPDKFVDKLLDMAYDGDMGAIREVLRRLEGEVLQPIALVRQQAVERAREMGMPEQDIAGFVARAEEIATGKAS